MRELVASVSVIEVTKLCSSGVTAKFRPLARPLGSSKLPVWLVFTRFSCSDENVARFPVRGEELGSVWAVLGLQGVTFSCLKFFYLVLHQLGPRNQFGGFFRDFRGKRSGQFLPLVQRCFQGFCCEVNLPDPPGRSSPKLDLSSAGLVKVSLGASSFTGSSKLSPPSRIVSEPLVLHQDLHPNVALQAHLSVISVLLCLHQSRLHLKRERL